MKFAVSPLEFLLDFSCTVPIDLILETRQQ